MVAVERVLFPVNVRTAIGVAQAAGIAMAEAVAAGAEVAEYSPNEVKQAVTGDGAADKDQIERMVQTPAAASTSPSARSTPPTPPPSPCATWPGRPMRNRIAVAAGDARRR